MTTDQTPVFDSPMRAITIQIPTPVAHKINETFDGTLEDAARAGLKLLHGLGPTTYNRILDMAKERDTTPVKLLRMALDLVQKETDYTARTSNVGRPKINQARDAEIYEQLKAGLTHAVVAKAFNISLVRIGQIAAQQRLLHGDAPRGRVAPRLRPEPVQSKQTPLQPMPERTTPDSTPDSSTQEVLSLKETTPSTPAQPRKLAVIPPSMRNPELFRKPEDRPQPVPVDKLDTAMFEDEYPLDEVFNLRGLTKRGE